MCLAINWRNKIYSIKMKLMIGGITLVFLPLQAAGLIAYP